MKKITFIIAAAIFVGFNSCKKTGNFVKTLCGADSTYNYTSIDSIPAMLFMANAFTPDGNGLNDCYRPAGNNISENGYLFKIFKGSRELFVSTSKYLFWNGTNKSGEAAGAGTYKYKVVAKLDGVSKTFEGDVTVLLKDSKGNCLGTNDFSKLTFQDMIDASNGFVYPTNEPICN